MWYDFDEKEIAILVAAYKQLMNDYGAEFEDEVALLEKIEQTERKAR